ncbi:MAG: DUF2169 domain-containing protein [Myxococcales bacterium]
MPPLDNRTSFAVHPQLLIGRRGEQLAVAIKATYVLSPKTLRLELAPEDLRRQIRMGDIPWGEPGISSIKYPSDLAITKPGTDVVVVAKAYPPKDVSASRFDVFAKVGELSAALVIYGLRVWDTKGSGFSAPLIAKPVELRYENAWGGTDDSDPTRFVEEPRNPVGRGVASDPRTLTGKIAPCIEYAEYPIGNAKTYPPPAGMGAVARHWEPRRSYAGTYDKAWKDNRAPLIPDDEDDRIHCFAARGLHAQEPLLGTEEVGLLNLVPEAGATRFRLPGAAIEVEFRVSKRDPERLRPHLDTIIIDTLGMDQGLPLFVELLWHASTRAPRRVSESTTVVRKVALS